ncbi:hypothetical protein [Aurantiacibacter gilvus]|uniref:Uncharacterized protein n=1 Tax=Aurantiacibacter gilvus TaxID=3139141 RepID=A0ABU9IDT3_9SPHN
MTFQKESLARCYLEAAAIWFGGNILMGWISYLLATFGREQRPRPWAFAESVADPGFLIANLLMILLFAAMLRGMRKPTGKPE